MTAPAAPSVTRSVLGGSHTDHLVTMPDTVEAGRLLVVATASIRAVTEPDGWALAEDGIGTVIRLHVFKRVADGTEGGTTVNFETDSPDALVAHVFYFSEADYDIDDCVAISGTFATGSNTSPNPPSLTHGWGSTDFMSLALAANYATSFTGYPSSYSGGVYDATGTAALGSAYRSRSSLSSEDPGTFTLGSGFDWCAATVAVRLNPTPPTPDPPTISDITPATFAWGEQLTITCADNGASKGSGKFEISDNATYASGTKQVQSTASWVDGEIIVNTVQGSFGAGPVYAWITNDNGDRNSTGFSLTATEDEPTPPPEISGTVMQGALQVQIYGSPPVAMIDAVLEGASIDEGIEVLPSASFSASMIAAGVSSATEGKEIGIRRQGEGEIFRGYIVKRTEKADESGAWIVAFDCIDLGIELQRRSTGRSVLVQGQSVAAAASALLDGTGWTVKVTGSGYPTITKEWINVPVLQAIGELAHIAGGYWRRTNNLREIEIINTNPDSGIIVTNPSEIDPSESRFGAIKSIASVVKDVGQVVNRVWGEVKTDQARLVTLQESTRSSPYTIESAFVRSPRYISHVAALVLTGAFETVLNALGENRYALTALMSDGIATSTIARLGGQFMAQLELVPDAGGSGVTIGHWGGIPTKGSPAVDIDVDIPSGTYAFAMMFEGVDQVSHFRESDIATGSSTSPSITIDSAEGDLVIGVLWMRTVGNATITPTALQELIGANTGAGTNALTIWQKPGGASTTTLSWTINSSRSWAAFAVSLKPASKWYIEDTDSQDDYGLIEMPVPLPSFGEVDVDNEALANTVYDYLADYLTKHKVAPAAYGIALSFLPGSPKDWLPGDTMAVKHRDAVNPIDGDLIAVSRSQTFGAAGERNWQVDYANVAMFRRDEQGAWLIEQMLARLGATQANQV